jgi:hypothetical protein
MFRTATVRQKGIPAGSQADLARQGIRTLKGTPETPMQMAHPRETPELWNTDYI